MDVISAILEIDNTAKEMMKNAENERDKILSDARENEKSVKDNIMNAAQIELADFDKKEKENADREREKIRTDTQDAIRRLDEIFEKDHQQWEQQIFDSIIG